MVLDSAKIRFLSDFADQSEFNQIKALPTTHIVVFQAQVCNSTLGCRLALGQLFVDWVDALRNVVEGLVEEVAAT